MGVIEILLIGCGLSMDAFAVSVCKGLGMNKVKWQQAGIIALFFGTFQGVMPLIGYVLGKQFAEYIGQVDYLITIVLLGVIGFKMIQEALEDGREQEEECQLNAKELFVLAIATSIDALAVGVTFAFLKVDIWMAIIIIGTTTFMISYSGVYIGNRLGSKLKSRAEILGGLILIGIGIKVFMEHWL